MKESAIVTVDWNQGSGFSLLNVQPYFEKRYQTKLEGCGFLYANHPNYEYPEHCYLQHTVVVYLRTQNSVRQIGDTLQSEHINFGDVAIIPAYINHWKKAESQISEIIMITIAPNILSRLAREKMNARSIKVLHNFAQPNLLVQSIASNLKAGFDSGKCNIFYVESLYNALMMHLLNNHSQKEYYSSPTPSGLAPYKLKQALKYINNNIDKSIKIRDVAKLLGISQYYFCRLFRESTGITPYRYVIQQRVSKAKRLITENKMSLLDITFECGFSSQSQMTHHFHKLVGVTPKVYRDRFE